MQPQARYQLQVWIDKDMLNVMQMVILMSEMGMKLYPLLNIICHRNTSVIVRVHNSVVSHEGQHIELLPIMAIIQQATHA